MRQRVIPILAPVTKGRPQSDGCYETKARGLAVLNSPLLNKGSAFTAEERGALGLAGLLPPDISTLGAQVRHAYIQYERLPDSLSKNVYLTTLHDRNEVLFYRLRRWDRRGLRQPGRRTGRDRSDPGHRRGTDSRHWRLGRGRYRSLHR